MPDDAPVWYLDLDGDGVGGELLVVQACEAPTNGYADAEDCDDGDPLSAPGATEICDGSDNDCDGLVDEGAQGQRTWYFDGDSDGYGIDSDTETSCVQPVGYAAISDDCDDVRADINPGVAEICNSLDDDCDGSVDESDAIDGSTWYVDADGDGFGSGAVTDTACEVPPGFVANAEDCNDLTNVDYPGADELCDGRDNDCDSVIDEDDAIDVRPWYRDVDGDGYGDLSNAEITCNAPAGYVADSEDCDDLAFAVNPSADEQCDGIDNDCDNTIDEDDAIDTLVWYADTDQDGFGNALDTTEACEEPEGYSDDNTDCDDTDIDVNPIVAEVCDGVDNDCSGFGDDGDVCPCNVHWAFGDPHPYMFCTTLTDWFEARDFCADYGYHLLTVNNADENIWTDGVSDTYSNEKWWLGLHDNDVEGDFVWENGEDVEYTNWHAGEPNDWQGYGTGGEDCTQFNRWGDQTWNDEPCEFEFQYICEAWQ